MMMPAEVAEDELMDAEGTSKRMIEDTAIFLLFASWIFEELASRSWVFSDELVGSRHVRLPGTRCRNGFEYQVGFLAEVKVRPRHERVPLRWARTPPLHHRGNDGEWVQYRTDRGLAVAHGECDSHRQHDGDRRDRKWSRDRKPDALARR